MSYTPDDYDAAADLAATGAVTCDSCGARVRTSTLVTLPDHGCGDRQRRNEVAERNRIPDLGDVVDHFNNRNR